MMLRRMQGLQFAALFGFLIPGNMITFVGDNAVDQGPVSGQTTPEPAVGESPKEIGKSHPVSVK
jgi:hypothetical protein